MYTTTAPPAYDYNDGGNDSYGNYANASTSYGNASLFPLAALVDPASQCNVLEKHAWLEAKLILISICGTMVGAFGVFGNITTALILTRPAMRSPNNLYLTALAIFDTCLLITAFMLYGMEYIIEYTETFELYIAWLTYLRFTYALSHISQTGSVYTTVAVTIERFLAVVYPQHSKRVCTKHGAAISILFVTCFSILFNCTKFFELEVLRDWECASDQWQTYKLGPGTLTMNETYQTVFTLWIVSMVMIFFPFVILLIGNSMIAIAIRKSMRSLKHSMIVDLAKTATLESNRLKRERELGPRRTSGWAERISRHTELKEKSRDATRVLVVIVFIFLLCNFWGFVLALVEKVVGQRALVVEHRAFYSFSREAINFLAIVNSSINFVIYCIFGKDFRKELVVVYGCGSLNGFAIALPADDKFRTWRKSRIGRGANDAKPPSPSANAAARPAESPFDNIGMSAFTRMFIAPTSPLFDESAAMSNGEPPQHDLITAVSDVHRTPDGHTANVGNGHVTVIVTDDSDTDSSEDVMLNDSDDERTARRHSDSRRSSRAGCTDIIYV